MKILNNVFGIIAIAVCFVPIVLIVFCIGTIMGVAESSNKKH